MPPGKACTAASLAARVGGAGGGATAAGKRKAKEVPSEMSVRVASADGVTSTVRVPVDASVSDVKVAVGKARDAIPATMELFVKGQEDALPNAAQLSALNIRDGAVVFLAQRAGKTSGQACFAHAF
jgi:hypothetical protein